MTPEERLVAKFEAARRDRFRVLSLDEARAEGFAADVEDYDEYGWCIVDMQDRRVLGCDGGPPEDQLLVRNWSWVAVELNRLATAPPRVPVADPSALQLAHDAIAGDRGEEQERIANSGLARLVTLLHKHAREIEDAVETAKYAIRNLESFCRLYRHRRPEQREEPYVRVE